MNVSLAINGETTFLGALDATSDDPIEGVATCREKASTGSSRLVCGATPAYNFFTVKLQERALVVSKTTGVEGEPSSEKVVEVKRFQMAATTMTSHFGHSGDIAR